MRVIARVLLPVLLAGSLAACSSESDEGLPTVKGEYGAKPKVAVAKDSTPSKQLESKVLVEGDGPEVERGDLLVADYLGKNYRSGKVFDNSYDRGVPAAFTLKSGPGGVISGWVKALTGVPVGSRVLLVAPPKDGYGKTGNPQAGIKGKDSLIFVVDVLASYSSDQPLPESTPETGLPAQLPAVKGEKDPEVTVPADATPPKEPRTTVVARGTGPEVKRGQLLVVHYTAVGWDNSPLSSSWQDGPQGVPVGGPQPSPFDLLIGTPVGSRVMLELPAQTGADASKESVAVVIDILGQHGPAKESAK